MTNLSRVEALADLAKIRELLQSAHWAARDLAQGVPLDMNRLLDEIHAARKAAETIHSELGTGERRSLKLV